ncbi:MAG: hypothetical protein K2M91_14965 [Lachnospiraceae bacterium]|nr:hypothetical protein [Lachnospiraceae bacterium]
MNHIFELSMFLDNERFWKVLDKAYKIASYMKDDEKDFIDHSLSCKVITVVSRDSQYKRKYS